MRVLLTGAGGFVGSHVLRRLLRDGKHAVAVLLRSGRSYPRIEALENRVEVIRGDLSRCEGLVTSVQRFGPDVIVHGAWAATAAENRNSLEHAEHVTHTINTIRLAQASGATHFIGLGSQAEYGAAADRNRTQEAGRPTTLYGTSKLCAGLLAERVCGAFGMRFVWLRLFSAYGPGEDPTWLIPNLCARLFARERPATTAGEQVYDYLFIDDVAEAVCQVAMKPEAAGFFDLGSGCGHSVREVIERVRDLIDPSLPLSLGQIPYGANQIMRMEANVERLQAITGWRPQTDLDSGLRRTVDWYRQKLQ
jgi:UDP-glucose 4-epimerase